MSGSLLGRGRAGRLAVYAGCGVVVFLLVFLYNTSTSEMARLKDLHTQCAHQQEALAAQLQVIFEYKVRLEKSLAEEKSSNAAVKQELQQRASREKSLRDKDSVEAMQRFNSLQQTYKLLQTEHKDLQEECKKRQKQALDDTTKLEETLKELRGHLRQAREEKEKSLEHLKTKYLELEVEKSRLEEKYNDLLKSNGNTNSTIDHLKKEVFQLKRELADTKKSCKSPSIDSILASIPTSQKSTSQQQQQPQQDPSVEKWGAGAGAKQAPSQQQQQQNSASTTSMRGIPVLMKSETSTKSHLVAASTIADKAKLMTKVKLPLGVVPIPVMMDSNVEDKQLESVRKKNDAFSPMRNSIHAEIKEKKNMDVMNLDAPPPAVKHVAEQILNRQDNDIMFRVRPGIQEIGDEPNHMGQMPGLDDGMAQNGNDGDQDQYDNEFYKERQQKNNDLHLEGEEEAEDEDDQLDYINDTKQDKRD